MEVTMNNSISNPKTEVPTGINLNDKDYISALLAITVGGGLFGILGMLVALPVTSIIYTLVVNEANKRIVNKNKIKKENFV